MIQYLLGVDGRLQLARLPELPVHGLETEQGRATLDFLETQIESASYGVGSGATISQGRGQMDELKHSEASPMRITGAGRAVFAAIMIALGIQGLVKGDFTAVWQLALTGIPGREALIYLCASISLASGIGLLWKGTAALAARVLLASLVLWFLVWRVRALFIATLVDSTWSCGETMAMMAGAWVLYVESATDWDRRRLGFATGDNGVRIARALYGLALIPFGYAHFAYLQHTADMVPGWLPWHLGWAYFTGAAFIAASMAILFGVFARLAAALSALQMGLFGLLVWIPILAAGPVTAFQQREVETTFALTAAGWVVADSYRGTRWFSLAKRQR